MKKFSCLVRVENNPAAITDVVTEEKTQMSNVFLGVIPAPFIRFDSYIFIRYYMPP